jgi:hypothetical protein
MERVVRKAVRPRGKKKERLTRMAGVPVPHAGAAPSAVDQACHQHLTALDLAGHMALFFTGNGIQ